MAIKEGQQVDTFPSQMYGWNGSAPVRLLSDTNGSIAVYGDNHICNDNTTDTPLLANATFTGDWQDCLEYQEVNISVDADQNSATNGLVIQWSADGVNVADTDIFSVYANAGTNYTPNPAFRYVKVVYTNGATPQGRFSLMTILRRSVTGGSFHRIDSTLKDDSDGRLTITIPKLKTAANNYVSQTATTAGNAKISLEELETGVSDNNKTQLKTSMYGKTGDNTFQVPRVDASTHTLQFIDYSHHKIHAGSHFEIVDVVDLALNNVRDIRFTTPNTTTWGHFLCGLSVESETEIFLYEGVTIVTAGTPITPINNNRNSSNTSTISFNFIDNASVVDANADTTVSAYLEHCITGAGKDSGTASRENEYILKQNTTYSIRLIAKAAGYVNYRLNWYENANKVA